MEINEKIEQLNKRRTELQIAAMQIEEVFSFFDENLDDLGDLDFTFENLEQIADELHELAIDLSDEVKELEVCRDEESE